MEDLKFKGNDPGAVQHGNFINYYSFHPPEERIKLLPENIWKTDGISYCLDVGCNSGDLTKAFHIFLGKCGSNNEILGVDIDPVLIQRARESHSTDKIQFECSNVLHSTDNVCIHNYLHNKSLKKFDVITCFSITMWIHLNNGDQGLVNFLKTISELGELIVIEPQPWKCYRTAVKRLKKSGSEFPLFNTLKHKHNIEEYIENILTTECKRTKIMETDNTKWGRKLLFFQ